MSLPGFPAKKSSFMAAAGASGKDEPEEDVKSGNGVRYHSVRVTLPQGTAVGSNVMADHRTAFETWLKKHCAKWMYQVEDPSKELKNVHFQSYVYCNPKIRSDQLRMSLWADVLGGDLLRYAMCNVSPASNTGLTALKKYVMKTETRISGPWSDSSAPVPLKVLEEDKLYDWQKEIIALCKEEPDDRKIYWITDVEGGHGKSALTKHLFVQHKACVIRYAKVSDMTMVVAGNKHKSIYIFDLSRSKPADFKMDDLYSLCEALKDGMITSGKFHSETWVQNTAHVIIFSNFHPEKGKLSTDRLVEWELNLGQLCQ